MTAQHTPGPWECIDATEHHGFYITSSWGGTVCDLYTMSNPTAASVRNGGDSFPIAHQEGYDEANARLVSAAPELLEAVELVVGSLSFDRDNDLNREVLRRINAAIAKATGA